jgi:hypothetical protein
MALQKEFFVYRGIPVTISPTFGWTYQFGLFNEKFEGNYVTKPQAVEAAKIKIDSIMGVD